jgi:hypothetical protein
LEVFLTVCFLKVADLDVARYNFEAIIVKKNLEFDTGKRGCFIMFNF